MKQLEGSSAAAVVLAKRMRSGEDLGMVAIHSEQTSSQMTTTAQPQQISTQLTTAIDLLPELERLVLAMVYLEGLSIAEASLVLDMAPSELLHLHASALEQLRIAAVC